MGFLDSISNEDRTSKINSGGLITLRMDRLWDKAHTFASTGRYIQWNAILDRVWCELVGDSKKGDKEKFLELTMKLPIAQHIIKPKGFSKTLTMEDKYYNMRIYRVLMDKEAFIRALQNKQGKGTAYDDNDEW